MASINYRVVSGATVGCYPVDPGAGGAGSISFAPFAGTPSVWCDRSKDMTCRLNNVLTGGAPQPKFVEISFWFCGLDGLDPQFMELFIGLLFQITHNRVF